jgi:fructosamine-3-kinase
MGSEIEQAKAAVARFTGRTPRSGHRIAGSAFEIRLDGTTLFAKTAPSTMPGAIPAEAASLAWLSDAGTVPVPVVHGHDEQWLVLEYLPPTSPSPEAAEEFGQGLARLHSSGADGYGAPPPHGPADAWIGMAPMRNEVAADWPTFYATQRVEPYVRDAVNAGVLSSAEAAVFSHVCDRVDTLAGPPEPPARLHGDLWSGNVHWSDGRAWLTDPAAHGGHRETDLAMLHLFGCPHLDRVVAAYQEVNPLAEGWRDRIELHQLFPLLVHAVLFGRGYAMRALAAARAVLP